MSTLAAPIGKRKKVAHSPPRVGLLLDRLTDWSLKILHGIARYTNAHERWQMFTEPETVAPPLPPLEQWDGDGLITFIYTRKRLEMVRRLKLPTVNLSTHVSGRSLPTVNVDSVEVGRLAAEHLLERGHQSFGFYGVEEGAFSSDRWEGFSRRLAEDGLGSARFELPWSLWQSQLSEQQMAGLARWVDQLPRPAAVFAITDVQALHVLDACRLLGVAVPEEMAVLGVDNVELRCQFADPPLSSVVVPVERIGYEAAKVLATLLRGERPPQKRLIVPPEGVVTRRSTDMLALDDPDMVEAVRFIHDHACDPIGVRQVLEAVPVAKRSLERKFHDMLGRSPRDEILRVRLGRVKQLLTDTDLTMPELAQRTGFCDASHLSALFRRKVGITPTAYRRARRV